MRKAVKDQAATAGRESYIDRVQGYHEGSRNGNYAYQGFGENRYYTSDRYIKLDSSYRRVDGKPVKGFGHEREVACNTISSASVLADVIAGLVYRDMPDGLIKQQADCTIAGRGETGSEVITQIMTKEFIRNNYPKWRQVIEREALYGIKPTLNCGQHINVSLAVFGATKKSQDEAVRKLGYILNYHYDKMLVMLHRDRHHTDWCGRMDATKAYWQSCDLSAMSGSHGNCYNLGHYNEGRVEIRMVGPQPTYPNFRNTYEVIFHLCDAVKSLSWSDCDDFCKIWVGCNAHVFDRIGDLRVAGLITVAEHTAIAQNATSERFI